MDSLTLDYPEEAFPGAFYFNPVNDGHLSLTLRLTLHDSRNLIPIILASPEVEVAVWLSATKADIAATKEALRGDIISYEFSFRATK